MKVIKKTEREAFMSVDKQELDKMWAEVKRNSYKLKHCSKHEFEKVTVDGKYTGKWICKNCGGTADVSFIKGYEQGQKHEREEDLEQITRLLNENREAIKDVAVLSNKHKRLLTAYTDTLERNKYLQNAIRNLAVETNSIPKADNSWSDFDGTGVQGGS